MTLPAITSEEAKRLIDQGATLVDIRGADERAQEHIPGSHHGPLAQMTNFAGVGAPIIFHCRSGMRTTMNAARLKEAAPSEAYVLSGGIDAWKRAGLPVITAEGKPVDPSRQIMIAGGGLVLLGVPLDLFVAPVFYGLAALAAAGLVMVASQGLSGMARRRKHMPLGRPAGA
jgi:rhodanese-related sulfurtransferase